MSRGEVFVVGPMRTDPVVDDALDSESSVQAVLGLGHWIGAGGQVLKPRADVNLPSESRG